MTGEPYQPYAYRQVLGRYRSVLNTLCRVAATSSLEADIMPGYNLCNSRDNLCVRD